MHRAFNEMGLERGVADYVIDAGSATSPIIGRLVDKGLHDELTGEAYAVIDGNRWPRSPRAVRDTEAFVHAPPTGGIVEVRRFGGANVQRPTLVLANRSVFDLTRQVPAAGATWRSSPCRARALIACHGRDRTRCPRRDERESRAPRQRRPCHAAWSASPHCGGENWMRSEPNCQLRPASDERRRGPDLIVDCSPGDGSEFYRSNTLQRTLGMHWIAVHRGTPGCANSDHTMGRCGICLRLRAAAQALLGRAALADAPQGRHVAETQAPRGQVERPWIDLAERRSQGDRGRGGGDARWRHRKRTGEGHRPTSPVPAAARPVVAHPLPVQSSSPSVTVPPRSVMAILAALSALSRSPVTCPLRTGCWFRSS